MISRACATGLLAVLAVAAPGRAVDAQTLSGRGLLTQMAALADRYGQMTWRLGRVEESTTWSSWALLYRGHAQGVPLNMSARDLSAHGVAASIDYARKSMQLGNAQLVRFYRASAAYWQDLNRQLSSGAQSIQIRFPQEMLMMINGAPGTPWAAWGETRLPGSYAASTGYQLPGAPAAGRGGTHCPACGGAGRSVCFTCKGTGQENYQAFANFYGLSDDASESLARRTRYTCTSCGGSGFKKCIGCAGTGRLGGR